LKKQDKKADPAAGSAYLLLMGCDRLARTPILYTLGAIRPYRGPDRRRQTQQLHLDGRVDNRPEPRTPPGCC